ncbi:MAG: LptF/LptG family permease [Alphaproteobacteria bacterium]|nr:LptF/LptG family permease [Alphaproteobacteria bacterium]
MIKNWTISRYLASQYALWFAVFMCGLAGIIFLLELAELFRRAADLQEVSFGLVMKMGFYKLPNTIDKILPFVVLFSGMFTFWKLTRNQELIVARAAGISAWQFLAPALIVTLLFSLFNLALINPVGAAMNSRFKDMETRYMQRSPSLELTGSGLWLRQSDKKQNEERHYLLHADRVELDPLTMIPLIVFIYDKNDRYLGRIDAPKAVLNNNYWEINDAWFNWENQTPNHEDQFRLGTNLTLEKIQESMAPPDTISLWELPNFIRAMKSIGLPPIRHELQLQVLLAQPLLLCAMVFFAAAFSLRISRKGGIIQAILLGLLAGSMIFSLNNIVNALGANQTFPIILAAWAIPLAAIVGGNTVLLYLEDG